MDLLQNSESSNFWGGIFFAISAIFGLINEKTSIDSRDYNNYEVMDIFSFLFQVVIILIRVSA